MFQNSWVLICTRDPNSNSERELYAVGHLSALIGGRTKKTKYTIIKKELDAGNRTKFIINSVVNRVVPEMRCTAEFIPAQAFKIVARKLVDKYPKTFKVMDEEGNAFGDGTDSMYAKLHDRNVYLNRPHMKRSLIQTLNVPLKKQKKISSSKAGCSNWQPKRYSGVETTESIEEKRLFLYQSSLNLNLLRNPDAHEKVMLYLELTYPAQRLFLNNFDKILTIDDIMISWPFLLNNEFMFWHYQKLMNHSISILEGKFLKKKKIIKAYGDTQKNVDMLPAIEDIKCIKIIMHHFKENFNTLFKQYNEGTNLSELDTVNVVPCIIIVDISHNLKDLLVNY
ncbi:uncharacterized protein [Prorops nasuta]|uniref:uncharacterized protein n=1 Tax=Prorops nasuta TaxID=863751 RepID=UPI0034CDF742